MVPKQFKNPILLKISPTCYGTQNLQQDEPISNKINAAHRAEMYGESDTAPGMLDIEEAYEYLDDMGDEIQTSMEAIIGMTTLLSDTKLDAEQRDYNDILRRHAGSLQIILNTLLDFSNKQKRRKEILPEHLTPFNSEEVNGTPEKSGRKSSPGTLYQKVMADTKRMRQTDG